MASMVSMLDILRMCIEGIVNFANIPRQVGLSGRYVAQGIAALPSMLWNVPVDAANALAGTRISRADITPALDAIGLPRAETPTERIAQDVIEASVGTGGVVKLAQRASAGMAGRVARAVSALFADSPAVQLASAASGAGAAGLARENDVGAMGQSLAALGGGIAPAAVGSVGAAVSIARRAVEQSRLTPTGTGPWGHVYGRLAGDTENAVAHLLRTGQGSVPTAATHPRAGAIELVAGQPVTRGGSGVLHVQAHGRDEALRRLPDLLTGGTWYGRVEGRGLTPKNGNPEQSFLSDGEYETVLRNLFTLPEGNLISRPWIPTVYRMHPEMRIPLETGQFARASNFTQIAPPSSGTNGTPASVSNVRDPLQYVGIDSPDQAAAKNAIAVQSLRDMLARALTGTALGQAVTAP